jgi:hypothetical protein
MAASGHSNPWEFAPDPPKHTIGKFMCQFDRLSDGARELYGLLRLDDGVASVLLLMKRQRELCVE